MTEPRCPECQEDMVLREGKYGKFWGCRSYPSCTGSMNLKVAEAESKVDDQTRGWRTKAAEALNGFATARGWTKTEASKWVRETMGLNWDDAKVNLFSVRQCELLLAYIKLETSHSSESEMVLAMRRANQKKKNF
jgi:ssDNA-binding Zn-finger/Zn-ribbon topoisomerase 1